MLWRQLWIRSISIRFISNIPYLRRGRYFTSRTQWSFGSAQACPRCGYDSSSLAIDTPSSPLADLIYTNHSTSPSEVIHVQPRLGEMETDIHRPETGDNLRHFSTFRNETLSSIQCLPPEMLVQIYQNYGEPLFGTPYQPALVCRF